MKSQEIMCQVLNGTNTQILGLLDGVDKRNPYKFCESLGGFHYPNQHNPVVCLILFQNFLGGLRTEIIGSPHSSFDLRLIAA